MATTIIVRGINVISSVGEDSFNTTNALLTLARDLLPSALEVHIISLSESHVPKNHVGAGPFASTTAMDSSSGGTSSSWHFSACRPGPKTQTMRVTPF